MVGYSKVRAMDKLKIPPMVTLKNERVIMPAARPARPKGKVVIIKSVKLRLISRINYLWYIWAKRYKREFLDKGYTPQNGYPTPDGYYRIVYGLYYIDAEEFTGYLDSHDIPEFFRGVFYNPGDGYVYRDRRGIRRGPVVGQLVRL